MEDAGVGRSMERAADEMIRFDFVGEALNIAVREGSGYAPSAEYHPTLKLGFCRVCKMTGDVQFPADFVLRYADRIMANRPVPVFCPRCGRTTEFVPLDITEKNANEPGLKFLLRAQNDILDTLGKGGGHDSR